MALLYTMPLQKDNTHFKLITQQEYIFSFNYLLSTHDKNMQRHELNKAYYFATKEYIISCYFIHYFFAQSFLTSSENAFIYLSNLEVCILGIFCLIK